MEEFKVENDMRTLKIIVKNSDYLSGWMIKPFVNIKAEEWTINQQKERLLPPRKLTKTQKMRFQKKKAINKMKQALFFIF